jgi:TRAP-type C4-dicarboxylate transport system permease small subunit
MSKSGNEDRLTKILRGTERLIVLCSYVGAAAIGLSLLIILADITARIISHTFEGAIITIELLLAAIAFMSLGYAQIRGTHVRVEFVVGRLRPKAQNVLNLVILILITGFIVALSSQVGRELYRAWVLNRVSSQATFQLPLWPTYFFALLGCIFFIVAFMVQIIYTIAGFKKNEVVGMKTFED